MVTKASTRSKPYLHFLSDSECHSQVESQCVHYAAGVNDVESVNPVVPIATVENTGTYVKGGIDKHVI